MLFLATSISKLIHELYEEKGKLVQSIRGAMGDMASPESATKAQPANGVPARVDPKVKDLRSKYNY